MVTAINLLGSCIILATILTALSVFLPYWIIDSGDSPDHFGVVSFSTEYENWYQYVSIEMYIAFALLLILCLMYPVLWFKRDQSMGYFVLLAVLSSSAWILELTAFIISLSCGFVSEYGITQTLGVSAYLMIPSSFAILIASFAARMAARQLQLNQIRVHQANNNC